MNNLEINQKTKKKDNYKILGGIICAKKRKTMVKH